MFTLFFKKNGLLRTFRACALAGHVLLRCLGARERHMLGRPATHHAADTKFKRSCWRRQQKSVVLTASSRPACSAQQLGGLQDVGGVQRARGTGAAVQGAERVCAARAQHDQDRVAAHAQRPHPARRRRRWARSRAWKGCCMRLGCCSVLTCSNGMATTARCDSVTALLRSTLAL